MILFTFRRSAGKIIVETSTAAPTVYPLLRNCGDMLGQTTRERASNGASCPRWPCDCWPKCWITECPVGWLGAPVLIAGRVGDLL